jgi:hypothetical protein
MRYVTKARLLLFVVPLLMSVACDNGDSPTIPSPAPTVTETFTGTLTQNGAATHPFTATTEGTVRATLTGVEPSSSPSFGFSMGTWDGAVCTDVLSNRLATTSAVLTGTVVSASSLCVRVFDSQGTIPADTPINYTIQVEHP